MLATYTRRMRNNSLEIRIARSSCRRQLTHGICKIASQKPMTGKARSILSLFTGDSLFHASPVIEPCHLSCELHTLQPKVYKLIDASTTSVLLFICLFLSSVISIDGMQCMVCNFRTQCFPFRSSSRGKTIIMISMLNSCKYSRTFANGHLALYNGHFFSSRRTKNPYIDFCLKPLYNGHFLQSPRWLRGSTVFQNPLQFIAEHHG